jgi:hypothetical protein
MKIQDIIEAMLGSARELGTFTLPVLLSTVTEGGKSGLAIVREPDSLSCLAIVKGEPEGAIFTDEHGERFGDTAVMLITGRKQFRFYEVPQDLVEALVMGCRIFEKTRVKQSLTMNVPEFGRKSEGLGHLTVTVMRSHGLEKGIRLSLRKEGKIVGSDFTAEDGTAGFRMMHGDYDCIVQDRNQQIRTFPVHFTEPDQKILIEL